jgi:hypothetical protein
MKQLGCRSDSCFALGVSQKVVSHVYSFLVQRATTAQPQEIALTLVHRGRTPTNHQFLLLPDCNRSDAERSLWHIERCIALFRYVTTCIKHSYILM